VSAGDLLVARVLPDVSGLDRSFDYLVPEPMRHRVTVGSMVRVGLHGRRVGGWVVALPDTPGVDALRLAPIAKWSGIGPSADVVALAQWAAVRWGSPRVAGLLRSASPPTMVQQLPAAVRRPPIERSGPNEVVRLSPNTDPLPLVLERATQGPMLLLHPSPNAWPVIARRLRRHGLSVAVLPGGWAEAAAGVDVVVGGRTAALAPCPGLATGVMLDEHDEVYQDERSPTWHARDVLVERARRAGAACVLVSPAPSAAAIALEWAVRTPALSDERAGWPVIEVVDRSDDEPWKRSLLSSALIRELRGADKVVCVINRLGRARLSACRSCKALQTCERCQAAVREDRDGRFVCERCAAVRPKVCQACGSSAMANVKPGVSKLREELEAAAGRAVGEVSGDSVALPTADVLVGTEAVLHRVGRVDVVAFLDFDAEMLAPRYRAAEQAMALLVRAARLVGPRSEGGRIMVQTCLPDHDVVRAVQLSDPGWLIERELRRRRDLGLPPYAAFAAVTGAGAAEFARSAGLSPAGDDDSVLVRHESWDALGQALAATPRPKGARLRVEVDPPRR
jgi:primosomal protein N' (replication factor Y) (superfamily II helicase)